MAATSLSRLVLSIFLLLLSFNLGEVLMVANGQKTWCVPKPSSREEELKSNIQFACNVVNCEIIQQGYPCFIPDTAINHASVVMNRYYQKMGRNVWDCNFRNSALVSMTDPSYGDCHYDYE